MEWKKIYNADSIIGLATLAFCGVWIVLGRQFPPGTQDGVPSCGTFPILVSIVLAAMGVVLLLRGAVHPTVFFGFTTLPKVNRTAILGTFAVLLLYLAGWYCFGYIAATIFMTAALGLLYRLNWKTVAIFSPVFSLATYCVFGKFFMIYMELH